MIIAVDYGSKDVTVITLIKKEKTMNKFEKKDFKNGMEVTIERDGSYKTINKFICYNEHFLNYNDKLPISNFNKELEDDFYKIIEIYENDQLLWKHEEPKKFGRQRVEVGEHYYFIDNYGFVREGIENNYKVDNDRFASGNYYYSYEEAEKDQMKQLAIVKVNDAIDQLNEGWEPDWEDYEQCKYYIDYSFSRYEFDVENTIYTKSEKNTKYMKNSNVAYKILEKYEKELKIILDVED